MENTEAPNAKTRFSIRSLLTLIAISALVFLVLKQRQQNEQMQVQIEKLLSLNKHLDASIEDAHEKIKLLRDYVQPELSLEVTPLSRN